MPNWAIIYKYPVWIFATVTNVSQTIFGFKDPEERKGKHPVQDGLIFPKWEPEKSTSGQQSEVTYAVV